MERRRERAGRDGRFAHEKAGEKSVTAEIRRKAAGEHRRTQGWLRQVAMPGEASGDARLPSAGGDFEACLFAQTSFCLARPIRSIEKELIEAVASLTRRRVKSQSLLKLDARRRKNIGGRKAGFARSQCPEKHPGTQGCLRQEAILKPVCSHRPVSALRDQ